MYTSEEFAQWTSSGWKNSDAVFPTLGISHDTRTLKAGEVYIAIRGEHHDGYDFCEQAIAKGAAGLIVDKDVPGIGTPQLIVEDTRTALWQIAAGTRSGWGGTVIGITGSAGKTTVKEMLASVLSQKGSVSKTPGNWNNDIGLPLSMIAADRAADFFVFELGMNHPGEIDLLASLLKPDWAMITTIGKAHIGFFQSLENIADEKSAIFKHTKHAVMDTDSEWFGQMSRHFDGATTPLTSEMFTVNQPGEHMIQNARFAATIGLELGLSHEQIQRGLDAFKNAPMRWQTVETGGVVLINDAYNANPLSMRAAISTFADMPCAGRKFLVLGGMRELGEHEEREHRELGDFVASFDFDRVIGIGQLGGLIINQLEKEHVRQLLCDELREGDMVLFKGSRGERLETIFEDLQNSI